jgi:adenine C2-methylase RlmN of 23S rRNA A2503 and tRNA A37
LHHGNREKRHTILVKEQLRDFFVANRDKSFRGNQVYEWLWSKGAHSFEDMTNVSKQTRTMLETLCDQITSRYRRR